MRIIYTCFTLLLFCAGLNAQTQYGYIASTGDVSLSSQTTAATIQQPATNALSVAFPASPTTGASVYCSVACTVTITRNSVGATATAGTIVSQLANAPTPMFNFFTASNVSGGTALITQHVAAGQTFTLDMSGVVLPTAGTTSNVTISVGSITGTVNITFFPMEQH